MLSVNGLTKAYAGKPAISDITFTVQPGEVVALLGANGSGKTTTIQSICRLLEWDDGDIILNGASTRASRGFQQNIGAVLGGCRNTNWRLTAKQNADYFARLRGVTGKDVQQRICALHAALGLDTYADKEVMKLSTGNKQKVALLCALSYQPAYVMLDEPTLGLDFTTIAELQKIIEHQSQHSAQGFLITSHDLGFIDKICSKVVVLDEGRLLFSGSFPDLKAKLFTYEFALRLNNNADYKTILETCWQGRYNHQLIDNKLIVNYEAAEQCLPTMHFLHQHRLTPLELTITMLSAETAYQTLLNQKESV